MVISRELDKRGITTPAAIGDAPGLPAAEATKLLTNRQWREGDVAQVDQVSGGNMVPGPHEPPQLVQTAAQGR